LAKKITMKITDLAYKISTKELGNLEKDLIDLYYRELFEKQLYTKQCHLFETEIRGVFNHLIEQEEEHSFLLKIILSNAGIEVNELLDIKNLKQYANICDTIKYDINQEKLSAQSYEKTINRTNSKKLKQLLGHILTEEYKHIGVLQAYLSER